MEARKHMVAKHPKEGKWYVMGFCGRTNGKAYWMPISDGYNTKVEAEKSATWMMMAEMASKKELLGWNAKDGYNA